MTVLPLARHPLRRPHDPLDALTPREREILALIAEGYSNAGICAVHYLSEKTVESHVGNIFRKLDLAAGEHAHRRVLAVLLHLRSAALRRSAA